MSLIYWRVYALGSSSLLFTTSRYLTTDTRIPQIRKAMHRLRAEGYRVTRVRVSGAIAPSL
jgi:hypothetical protein